MSPSGATFLPLFLALTPADAADAAIGRLGPGGTARRERPRQAVPRRASAFAPAMRRMLLLGAVVLALFGAAQARADDGCPGGSTSVTSSPDGGALSILFDSFSVSAGGSGGARALVATCVLSAPLPIPPGYSLGVYRVDYRGYAHLMGHESAELTVDYHLGPKGKSRQFRRKVVGPTDTDFVFTENIGAGLMKRIGCGEPAALNVSVRLGLQPSAASEAMATMDSSDAAAKRGLVYYFDFKKCGP